MPEFKCVKSKDGTELLVSIPITEEESKSGKSNIIASTHGNIPTTASHKGKVVVLSLNAYTRK